MMESQDDSMFLESRSSKHNPEPSSPSTTLQSELEECVSRLSKESLGDAGGPKAVFSYQSKDDYDKLQDLLHSNKMISTLDTVEELVIPSFDPQAGCSTQESTEEVKQAFSYFNRKPCQEVNSYVEYKKPTNLVLKTQVKALPPNKSEHKRFEVKPQMMKQEAAKVVDTPASRCESYVE